MPLGRFRVNRNSGLTGESQGSQPPPIGLGQFFPGGNLPPMPPGVERFMRRRGFQVQRPSVSPIQQAQPTEFTPQPKKKGIQDLLSRFGRRRKS